MSIVYIPRTLIADKGERNERLVYEAEIATMPMPLLILGEPGIGKTDLTKALETSTKGRRIGAGTFSRTAKLAALAIDPEKPLIIDGLDEITPAGGGSAVDDVLRKLDDLGRPPFVLSCRAADWQGSSDRWKIHDMYGREPLTLNLMPFTHEDALAFLTAFDNTLGAAQILADIANRGLQELAGNPLTLTMLAEVARDGQGLPDTRADLLEQACNLLVQERNRAHVSSAAAQTPISKVLHSAGAIFAHLLISNSVGVAIRQRDSTPAAFVDANELQDIDGAAHVEEAIGTRLFRSEGEGLFIPVHRVVAEYLGAKWLAQQISQGLSERRIFQTLLVAGGVPGPLRGLHAWLGHFNPMVADRCIRQDPYGVLRYGEPARLPIPRARLLLSSLAALAEEDPYFRSEDWGVRAVSGLARPELKDEIVAFVRGPDRHFHLSSLLLESLPGSTLTDHIVPELSALVLDTDAAYAERSDAAAALIASTTKIDWPDVTRTLRSRPRLRERRLGLEIMSQLRAIGFDAHEVAAALIDYLGKNSDRENDDRVVTDIDYVFPQRLTVEQSTEILDAIGAQVRAAKHPRHWRPGHQLASCVLRLVAKVLEGATPEAARLWSWLWFIDARSSHSTELCDRLRDYFLENTTLRRAIQQIAMHDKSIEGGSWIAIALELPQVNQGLVITPSDAAHFLRDLASKGDLTHFDITLWTDLVRSQGLPDKFTESLATAVQEGTDRHAELQLKWEELNNAPEPEWAKEERRRQAAYRRNKARKFARHRAGFMEIKDGIRSGQKFGALVNLSLGYLGRYSDLNNDAEPSERLRNWVGDEVAEAAELGFVTALDRPDLPKVDQIIASRLEGKSWHAEHVMVCGVAEMLRRKMSLAGLRPEVAQAVLAVWWDCPPFNSTKHLKELPAPLEDIVLHSDEAIRSFAASVVEPYIRAGREHVPGLYRLLRDPRTRHPASELAVEWLHKYPDASRVTQRELLHMALHRAAHADIVALVRKRLAGKDVIDHERKRLWLAAAFLLDLEDARAAVSAWADNDRDFIWSIRELPRTEEDDDRSHRKGLTLAQRAFILEKFATRWPVADHPSSGWVGDKNGWDATQFIGYCIDAIGAEPTIEASHVLENLAGGLDTNPYRDRIKHVRVRQRRARRDVEFRAPSFQQVRSILANGLPTAVDDLKALVLDRLEEVQDYLRNSDTNAWEAYWTPSGPKSENDCRDRTLDALRLRLPKEVQLLPEGAMPDKKRCDILAIHNTLGLPVEIKGQWHPDVWHASSTQLDDDYSRDWRADGRGVYLVLWLGDTPGRKPPQHPRGLPAPTSPAEMRAMLLEDLTLEQSAVIDVFVLDVSRPVSRTPSHRLKAA